jgi:hypothetical protein
VRDNDGVGTLANGLRDYLCVVIGAGLRLISRQAGRNAFVAQLVQLQ